MAATRIRACARFGAFAAAPFLALMADTEWHEISGGRWRPLTTPAAGGRPGFVRMDPVACGITFTNALDEAAGAANRVLEDGGGVAVGDFNGDGRPDIFLCSLQGRCALYENLGGWRFSDATRRAGLEFSGIPCRGGVFADVNGDRYADLLVSTLGGGVLCFLNDGAGHLTNATAFAGVATAFGSMTLALADFNGDGALDLYVANYRTDDIRDHARIPVKYVNGQAVFAPEYRDRLRLDRGGLFEFGEPDVFYLNDGRGRFSPVPWTGGAFLDEAGRSLPGPPLDWGLAATFRDLNGDGLPDLYVGNDYATPDRIWLNRGGSQFQAIDSLAVRHTPENSMGVDVADVDGDGWPDVFVVDMLSRDPVVRRRQALAQTPSPTGPGIMTNRPQVMRNALFRNRGDGTFAEVAEFAGVAASEWSWQPLFLDVDLDGRPDLLISAGHARDVQDLDATQRIKALQHRWPAQIDPKVHQEAFNREKMEHARLYPAGTAPIIAFRNLGGLRFADVTTAWGLGDLGVHQGMAAGDFDGDGDLDIVVNNLNGSCGLYRNEGAAPRVAVRLKGASPNTAGIGARIRLIGGPSPLQSWEMTSGGRYLSGCEELAVFAAGGATLVMTLEVDWRGGRRSVLRGVEPNRLYEVDETAAYGAPPPAPAPPEPLMTDATARLGHAHVENPFDDYARQPLLPRGLSQLGPALAWADLNGDGHDDLIVGAGAGGRLAIFWGDGRGGFVAAPPMDSGPSPRDQAGIVAAPRDGGRAELIVGESAYEDGSIGAPAGRACDPVERVSAPLPPFPASVGPLALGPIDGAGGLALVVGGRVLPGRYPEPAATQVFRPAAGGWALDEPASRALAGVGMVSGAVWSDLDGDGFPELVLACEWGPVRIFHNDRGVLSEATERWGLAEWTGLWAGVAAGDFDGDGRMDLLVSNWGLNSAWKASADHPLTLVYGDLNGLGAVDLMETEWDAARGRYAPIYRLDRAVQGLPFLRSRYDTFRAFAEASADEVLGPLKSKAATVTARTLASVVLLNRGGRFEARDLPAEAQFSPAFGVAVADFDGDGADDVVLSQNFSQLPPETPRQDAGRGLLLRGDGRGGFAPVSSPASGIAADGEGRAAAVADFNEDGRPDLAVAQNGAATRLFLNRTGAPGLRVRLAGPRGNPSGTGCVLRLDFGTRRGPAREIHAGSGYWSQDSAVQVMAAPATPEAVIIRWPGGRTTQSPVPAGAAEITVAADGTVRRNR